MNEKCEEFVVKQETGDAEDTSEDEEETPEDDLPMNDIKIEAVDDSEILQQTQHDIEDIQSDYQSDAEAEEGHEDGAAENKEGEGAPEDEKISACENGQEGDENAEDKEDAEDEENTEDSAEAAGEAASTVEGVSKKIISVDLTEDDDEEKEDIDEDKKLISQNQKLLAETSAVFESKNSEIDSKNRSGSEEKENQQSTEIPDLKKGSNSESMASLDSYMKRLSIIVNDLYKGRGLTKHFPQKRCLVAKLST